MPPLPFGRLGRWRLERLLGAGAAAQVYLGVDADGRRAAVKHLRTRAVQARERFAREAEALARLDHPGITRLIDADLTASSPWLAMTVVEGPSLETYADTLRRRPPRERVERARAIAAALADALSALHAAGLVHRDVKPQNVLVDAAGLPMLLDLGVVGGEPPGFPADVPDPPGAFAGTPATAAPEQHRGAAVPASDQYGLGCTLHLLLTGRRVFADLDGAALLTAHREERPAPPSRWDPTVPADLDEVVLRLLEKDPAARYPGMEAARAALLAGGAAILPLALPLAGRQDALDQIALVVRRVLAGEGAILHFAGVPGSGRRRLASLARDAADRAGVTWMDAPDAATLETARARLRAGEPLLVLSAHPAPDVHLIPLPPLTLADVRRSLHGRIDDRTDHDRTDLARAAELLHRRSGGNPGLLLRLLAGGPPDLSPWLADLSPAASALARALAAAPLGLPPSPADPSARDELLARGVAVVEPGVLRLAAEELRTVLLPDAPSAAPAAPEELRALVDALLDAPPGDPVPLARSLVNRADALDHAPLRAATRVALAWLHWEAGDLDATLAIAADASAATRAAGDTDGRVLSHALRAAATLARTPGDRLRGSVALDRLVSVDPSGASPAVLAAWHLARAEALDTTGDPRSAARARAEASRLAEVPATSPLLHRVREWALGKLGAV